MSNFFISTDMTADFPPELKGEDFRILPMSYVLDGVEYDGVTRPFLTPHEFYTALERGAQASTSMVPVETAKEYFLSMLGEGKDILHISFPAAMSGCYDGYLKAADLAIKEYPERRIVVIDGKSACSGEGLLAYYAMQKRDSGATLDETAEFVIRLRDHIGHAFTVSDLRHLYRGGRLSRGAAVVGQAIKLNPVLMVDENGALVHRRGSARGQSERKFPRREGDRHRRRTHHRRTLRQGHARAPLPCREQNGQAAVMPDRNNTNQPRSNSFRCFYTAETCG